MHEHETYFSNGFPDKQTQKLSQQYHMNVSFLYFFFLFPYNLNPSRCPGISRYSLCIGFPFFSCTLCVSIYFSLSSSVFLRNKMKIPMKNLCFPFHSRSFGYIIHNSRTETGTNAHNTQKHTLLARIFLFSIHALIFITIIMNGTVARRNQMKIQQNKKRSVGSKKKTIYS